MLAFMRVESQFYPQIGALYRYRVEAWAAAQRAERRSDQAEESVERQ
jgi:hypothetical protein